MKILWVPQLSVTDKDDNYILTADSNWRVATDVIQGMQKVNKDVEVHLLMPRNLSDESHLKEIKYDKIYSFLATKNIFGTRFHFDDTFVRTILEDEQYDLIWINDPCLTMNFRVASINCKKTPKIVSYNHWIDYSKSPKLPKYTYNIRQIEGALFSNLCLSNTVFSLDMWLMDATYDYFDEKVRTQLADKAFAYPPPYNEYAFKNIKVEKDGVFTVAYHQRLSSLPYYKYSWKKTFEIIKELRQDGFDIKVIAFNPAGKDVEAITDEYDFVEVVCPTNKEDYLTNLARCHITFDYYKDERIWSVAMVEACALDCLPFLQYFTGYKELYERGSFVYFPFQDSEVLKAKIKTVYHDRAKLDWEVSKAKQFMVENYSTEVLAKRFFERLDKE